MQNSKVILTVIIPFHEASRFLFDSTSWRLGLEIWNREVQLILVWDRARKDDSTKACIIDAFKTYHHLEIVEGHFGGPGTSRNAGLLRAKGEWVLFWDSDDQPLPRELFKVLHEADYDEVDYIVTSYSTFEQKTGLPFPSAKCHPHVSRPLDWYENGLGLWRIIFKRNGVENIKYPDISMGEDLIFFIRYLHRKPRPHFSKVTTYMYQVKSSNQLTSNRDLKQRESSEAFFMADLELCLWNQRDITEVVAGLYVRLFLSAVRHSTPLMKMSLLGTFTSRFLRTSLLGNFALFTTLLWRLQSSHLLQKRRAK